MGGGSAHKYNQGITKDDGVLFSAEKEPEIY